MMGNIPVLYAKGKSLAEAWENSLVELYNNGTRFKTEYDKDGDPLSIDSTMIVVVEEPLSEPRIHRCFPGGLDALEEYRQEVLDGIKDTWIRDRNNPKDTRWEYTYHERLFKYKFFNQSGKEQSINQIDYVIQKLAETPFTRRAQAITWKVWEDIDISDPACMQSLWFRILPDDKNNWYLNLNVRFRSNDAYDAAFMNMFALTALQEKVAIQLAKKSKKNILLGRYCHIADSYHIYGSRIDDFQGRFLKSLETRSFDERTWTMEMAQPFFDEAKPLIDKKIKEQEGKY